MNTVHTPSYEMRIAADGVSRQATERELLEDAIALDGKSIIELGCGRAELTRHVAQGADRHVLALEVDEIQHAHNAARTDLPNVEFRLAGAEAIPAADASFDVALMFKSLHHVPVPEMGNALREIGRVLRPGGLLFVSEPVFAGAFNEILRLFHDEQRVRTAAFDALRAAVAEGLFELVDEIFFDAPYVFADFGEFERRIIGVTHTVHRLTPEVHAEVARRFAAHCGPQGARFASPMRVDLLRRPVAR